MHNISHLTTHLNEIKIVHSSLNSLQLKDLKEIDQLMMDLVEDGENDNKVQPILEEFIRQNPKFYLAYYYLAIFCYLNQKSGDVYIKCFFKELSHIQKSSFTIAIANNILSYYESHYLLNCLAQQLEEKGEKEKLIEIWKKIYKLDPNDLGIGIKLAKCLESIDLLESFNYYQLVFLKAYDLAEYEEALKLFKKINQIDNSNHHFYLNWSKKLALKFPKSSHDESRESIFITLIKNEERLESPHWDYLIEIFKSGFESGVTLKSYHRNLLGLYKNIYQNHHFLEYFLKVTSLTQLLTGKVDHAPIKILELINDFEKKIQFDQGKLVEHQSFGIGIIKEIVSESSLQLESKNLDETKFIIDFEKKSNHQMSFRIVSSSLVVVSPDHLKGLKLFFPDRFQSALEGEEVDLLKMVMRSLGKPSTLKEIQDFMTTVLWDEEIFKKKWTRLKKILATHPDFNLQNKLIQIRDKQTSSFLELSCQNLRKTNILKNQLKIIDFYFSNSEREENNDSLLVLIENLVINPIENSALKTFLTQYLSSHYALQLLKSESKLEVKANIEKNQDQIMLEYEEGLEALYSHSMKIAFLNLMKADANSKNIFFELLKSKNNKQKEMMVHYLSKSNPEWLEVYFVDIEKSYHTHNELFVLLSQSYFSDLSSFPNHNQGEVLLKLIRVFSETYIKIDLNQDNSVHKNIFGLISKIFFDEAVLANQLDPSNCEISIENKQKIIGELHKLNFLENYLKLDLYKIEEKLK